MKNLHLIVFRFFNFGSQSIIVLPHLGPNVFCLRKTMASDLPETAVNFLVSYYYSMVFINQRDLYISIMKNLRSFIVSEIYKSGLLIITMKYETKNLHEGYKTHLLKCDYATVD